MAGAAGSPACLLRWKAKATQIDTMKWFLFVCLFDHFTGKHCSPQTGFLLQGSSSFPYKEQQFLDCWTGLICRKAKVEMALGGSNNETQLH